LNTKKFSTALQLNDLSTEELGKLFPVIISEHDPSWKDLFRNEKEVILKTIEKGNIVSLEHIGSTAVPGLCAKPTIDILMEITDQADIATMVTKLESIDYHYIPKPENPPPHMMFAKGYSEEGFTGQAYHIHARYKGDWDEPLFRDYLINHPETATEYGELKLKLAKLHPNDREKYTEAKTEFILKINALVKGELNE
jgi:GrpB-like predicted nucleotidyltransferase (UPF0157 family)